MVTTNIDWNKYIDSPLSEVKCVEELLSVVEIIKKYLDSETLEKCDIINQLFVGSVMQI